ncbi:hypothetical protein C8R43DRAFT_1135534 [Mycena crocata]|nr:hypothetical protein C8R43DRAFT_1135534 [Mycena crocata]
MSGSDADTNSGSGSSDSESDSSHKGKHKCNCAHTCGFRGKWIADRTYREHQSRLQGKSRVPSLLTAPRTLAPHLSLASASRTTHPSSDDDQLSQEMDNNQLRAPSLEQDDDVDMEDLRPTANTSSRSPSPPRRMSNLHPPHNRQHETLPSPLPEPQSAIEEIAIANKFIEGLHLAHIDNSDMLDADIIEQLLNPPQFLPMLSPDERLAIDLYLAITNASEETYNSARAAICGAFPIPLGVTSIATDMCINTCLGFTGPFADAEFCHICGEAQYDPKYAGAKVPRKQFHTIPLGPQLQAIHHSPEAAEQIKYCKECTDRILAELAANNRVHVSAYKDFMDGKDYIDAVIDQRIREGQM